MLQSIAGKKIGMTQVFDEKRSAISVTVVDVGHWYVTQIKTDEKDGYNAVQLGLIKKRYHDLDFSTAWLKDKKKYFSHLREVALAEDAQAPNVGEKVNAGVASFKEGSFVSVAATSIGKGFQGVMKRWGFAGGPGGHGSTFHRQPGSIGNMCSQGKVIKGKKLPGRTGGRRVSVKGLQVIRLSDDANKVFIKGSVPGKKDALVLICNQGS